MCEARSLPRFLPLTRKPLQLAAVCLDIHCLIDKHDVGETSEESAAETETDGDYCDDDTDNHKPRCGVLMREQHTTVECKHASAELKSDDIQGRKVCFGRSDAPSVDSVTKFKVHNNSEVNEKNRH